jgi:hypothetical protein
MRLAYDPQNSGFSTISGHYKPHGLHRLQALRAPSVAGIGPARPPAKKDLRICLTARNAIARLVAVKGRHLRKACIPGVATEKPLKRRFKKLPSVWFSAGDSLWIANICAALRF